MVYSAEDLIATLQAVPVDNYVRVVADWLTRGEVQELAPDETGDPVVDAMVGAAVAHLARTRGLVVPAWTRDPTRVLNSFWHSTDNPALFGYALAHAPAEFAARGVFIEAGSLTSV